MAEQSKQVDVLARLDAWGDLLESQMRTEGTRLDAMLREVTETRADLAGLLLAMRALLPFVATQGTACHGDKCRKPWCYSCFGDEAAGTAALGRAALHAAQDALARVQGGAA